MLIDIVCYIIIGIVVLMFGACTVANLILDNPEEESEDDDVNI